MSERTLSEIVSCLAGYDPDALPVDQAQQIIREFVTPLGAVEKVALRSTLGRVLAKDIISPINVPSHDNSAMDGYAFRASDLQTGTTVLKVVGSALAGKNYNGKVEPGECVQIMTGAVMPQECDTIIPQEFISEQGQNRLSFPSEVIKQGDNRRLKGEDLALGMEALAKGTILRPAHLGLIASLGIAEVPVQRRLRVAFFSTGDELRSLGEPLDEGNVYDSNRYTLYGMLTRLGCDLIDMGIIPDDPDLLESAFRSACENADVIITSGGVSVGAADYTKEIMARLGDMSFWKIGMRPGRPMAFGRIQSNGKSAMLFGLPGNPVAVMVTFYFLARDALLYMMGANVTPLPRMRVKSTSYIRKKAGRTEYQRGTLSCDADGQLQVSITGSQGSGILSSMAQANCMIVLRHDQVGIQADDMVDIVLFEGLV